MACFVGILFVAFEHHSAAQFLLYYAGLAIAGMTLLHRAQIETAAGTAKTHTFGS